MFEWDGKAHGYVHGMLHELNSKALAFAGLLLCLAVVGCGKNAVKAIPGTQLRFSAAAGAGFFDAPFPILYRMRGDSTLAVKDFPNPKGNTYLDAFIGSLEQSPVGFGTTSAIYFAFTGAIDQAALPDPADSLLPESGVFLVDIDPGSPARDQRIPVQLSFKEAAETYTPAHVLVVLPRPGFVLRANTWYAAVLTERIRDAQGEILGSPEALEQLKAGRIPAGPHGGALAQGFSLLWAHLERAGLSRAGLRGATVFKTGDPYREMVALREHILSLPQPQASGLSTVEEFPAYCVLEGKVTVPLFQSGTPPFKEGDGEIRLDARGRPVTGRQEEIRFSLTIPKSVMPAKGWPLLFYSAGQGGSYKQVYQRGTRAEQSSNSGKGPAFYFAHSGIASLSIEAPLVGPRSPTGDTSGMEFYDISSLAILRDNFRQTALDFITLVRLARALAVPANLCPQAGAAGGALRFDDSRFLFYGHSTGSMAGSILLGLEPGFAAGLLSGVGGSWLYNLVLKFEPIEFAGLVGLLMGYDAGDVVDIYDPVVNLFQTFAESAEPMNWARRWAREPAAGSAPKQVLIIEGVVDGYFPPPMINALALASGVEPVAPTVEESLTKALELSGGRVLPAPAWENYSASGGKASLLLKQYTQPPGMSGHYVPFQLPEPKYQYRCFFESFVRTGKAVVFPSLSEPLAPCPSL